MAQQDINFGAYPGDPDGDPVREGGRKINENFTDLYNAALSAIKAGPQSTLALKFLSLVASYPAAPVAETLYFVETAEFDGPVSVAASGNSVISVPHGQSFVPSTYGLQAANAQAAAGHFHITANATHVVATYVGVTPTGVLNYILRWKK